MKNKTITLQKTVYISGQDRAEGACVQPNSNIIERVHHEVMSDKKMDVQYKFDIPEWEYFPTYENKDARIDFYDFGGWNGLRKIFPFIARDKNVECLVTVIFESEDVEFWDDDCLIDNYSQDKELYNFHAESDFFVVETRYKEFMLCKGKDSLDWEIDDGHIKWDCDRENGGLIYDDSPLTNLFPSSKSGGNGVAKSYKCKVIVDAVI